MGRVLLITAIGALLVGVGYGLGAYAESYSLNQCYALGLDMLASQAEGAAASKNDAAIARFRRLVRAMPLAGPDTDCKRVQLVLDVPVARD